MATLSCYLLDIICDSSFIHILHWLQQNFIILPSKYTLYLTTSHHFHCTIPAQTTVSSLLNYCNSHVKVFLSLPWPPKRMLLKHESDHITPLLKVSRAPCLSFLWPTRSYIIWSTSKTLTSSLVSLLLILCAPDPMPPLSLRGRHASLSGPLH